MSVQVDRLSDAAAATALAALEAEERAAGLPLVDEAERLRLERLAADGARPPGWTPLAANLGGEVVGYGGVLVGAPSEPAAGDAAAFERSAEAEVLAALLAALASAADEGGAAELQVWVRRAGQAEIDAAASAGFAVARRLGVLGRSLDELPDELPDADSAPGVRVRAYRPDVDDEAVVAVLAAAYAGTDEAGWDLARFRERRGWPWFRAEDLLVAELEDGRIGGLHWLKRRGDGAGEVYNLAVHPDAQGRGLGPTLLAAGLRHLQEVGCHEVLLWVDLANARAVRLYRSQGFATRWEDIAFTQAR